MSKAVLAASSKAIRCTPCTKQVQPLEEMITPEEYLAQNPTITCRELDEKMFATGNKAGVKFYARASEILTSRKMQANLSSGK